MAEANARRERGTATGRPARGVHRAEAALPALLVALTAATGMVDAVSYLGLGHVFTANMTGNVVLLGFALAGAGQVSIPASLLAIAAFLAGAAGAGRLGRHMQVRRRRWIGMALGAEALLVVSAAFVALDVRRGTAYPVVVLLALAMGVRNATTRRLAIPDLTTTVLTLTLTGLAADTQNAGGEPWPTVGRRVAAVAAMLLGAAVGALLLRASLALPLFVVAVALAGPIVYYSTRPAEAAPAQP